MAPGRPAPEPVPGPAGRSSYSSAAHAPGGPPGPGGPAGAAYGPDAGYGPAYGPAGNGPGGGYGAPPRAHRRHRARPVAPRPECELGLHGCLGRDGLYHGKF